MGVIRGRYHSRGLSPTDEGTRERRHLPGQMSQGIHREITDGLPYHKNTQRRYNMSKSTHHSTVRAGAHRFHRRSCLARSGTALPRLCLMMFLFMYLKKDFCDGFVVFVGKDMSKSAFRQEHPPKTCRYLTFLHVVDAVPVGLHSLSLHNTLFDNSMRTTAFPKPLLYILYYCPAANC